MSLDVYLVGRSCPHCNRGPDTFFEANITHNLNRMAEAAGIYRACWRPEEMGVNYAGELVPLLRVGLRWLKENREEAEKYNATNGWGLYEHFVPWVEEYLEACIKYPEARVEVSR